MDETRPLLSGRRLPPGFTARVVVLAPGESRLHDEAEWHDALVLLEDGEVELECHSGPRQRFGRGAVLWLTGLGVRVLHSIGDAAAVLVAVSRR